ncbi:MAG: TetR/AcrR family transcriptional regulator [Caulobacteraceae bacterium]|nr:TetR/AcrR family transcriptional regulator [Caulobacteraceae bacterium]
MIATQTAPAERPSASVRRGQILAAAEECFRVHGFHAASMAEIAATAKMSPGLIYRYFSSKEHIIAAIVEQGVRESMRDADALEAEPGEIFPALFKLLREHILERADKGKCALFLEMMAEAARNPQVAQLVMDARARIARRLADLAASAAPGRWSAEDIAGKVDLLLILVDSVAFKAATDAALDREATAEQIIGYARRIFEQT